MIEIDGRRGGGQMLRTALTLSAIQGEDIRMVNIRGSRKNPGLKRQHVEAVKSVARLTKAKVEGLVEGSEELEFSPSEILPQNFTVNVGTAGSVNLILDTLMPLTTQLEEDVRFDLKGGTDVKWSPSSHYLRQVKLPVLKKFNFDSGVELRRHGFYPKGKGEIRFIGEGSSLEETRIHERGERNYLEIYSTSTKDLEEQRVADRQAKELERLIKSRKPDADIRKTVKYADADSTGSILCLKAQYDKTVAGFDAYGEKGKRSEKVAKKVFNEFSEFEDSKAAVDKYMADQLMVYLAIVGGSYSTSELTGHMETNMETIRKFGVDIRFEEREEETIIEV